MKRKQVSIRQRLIIAVLALAFPVITAGSGNMDRVGDTFCNFNVRGYRQVWDVPFPNDLGIRDDGTINMEGFPDTILKKTVRRIKDAVENGYGYSTNPTMYFVFNKPLHQQHIPDHLTTLQPGSPVFMMDVDPDSPERGRLFPLMMKFEEKRPRFNFTPKNTLSVMPVPGFALRENTTYAVVVMDTLRDYDHKLLNIPEDLKALKNGQAPAGPMGQKALDIHAPVFDYLKSRKINVDRVAAVSIFTTGDPTARMRKVFNFVKNMPIRDFSEPLRATREYDGFYVLEGAVMFPQFQPGVPPFEDGKGGVIAFDDNGAPIIVRDERVPVCVSVPKGKMPASGWPLMIYIHGTEGVSTQFIDRGPVMVHGGEYHPGSGPAGIWAYRGIAAVGSAVPQNAERGYDPSMLPYYNFFNIEAMRDNFIQSAAEQSMLLRTMKELRIDASMCPETDASASSDGKIYFDSNRIFGMGQSLGSLILGIFGAVEPELKVLFPSGAGAHFGVFVARMNPFGDEKMRKKGIGMGERLGIDIFHPIASLSQTALAPSDPGTFMRHVIENPFPGNSPKNVWLSLGQFDHYFSSEAQNGIMIGLGLDLVGQVNDGSTPEILALAGKKPLDYPVSGNIVSEGVKVTGVAVQFEQYGALDGHHINFQRQETKYEYGCFLRSYIDNGIPTLYPPRSPWDSPCGVE